MAWSCLSSACCFAPCFEPHVRLRDGRTAKDWWVLPDDVALPSALQGVFWLDGNSADPGLLSFNTSSYDARRREVHFQIYAVDSWASTTKLSTSTCVRSAYVVTLDESLTRGTIHTTFDWGCVQCACCLCNRATSCESICEFRMTLDAEDEDVWKRESWICRSCVGDRFFEEYNFTRVLAPDGTPTKYYDKMAKDPHVAKLYTRTPHPAYCGADVAHYHRRGPSGAKVAPGRADIER